MDNFSEEELQKINTTAFEQDTFTQKEKTTIIQTFIEILNNKISHEKNILGVSYGVAFLILSLVIMTSFIISNSLYFSTDVKISFIESILNGGGFHLALASIILGYFYLDDKSFSFFKNISIVDVPIAVITGLLSASIIIFFTGSVHSKLSIFTLITSITAVPFVEEVFFRYFIFIKGGKKYSYIFTALVSSSLFAVIHLPGSFEYFLSFFIISLIQCILIIWRKNIVIVILSHGIANLILQIL